MTRLRAAGTRRPNAAGQSLPGPSGSGSALRWLGAIRTATGGMLRHKVQAAVIGMVLLRRGRRRVLPDRCAEEPRPHPGPGRGRVPEPGRLAGRGRMPGRGGRGQRAGGPRATRFGRRLRRGQPARPVVGLGRRAGPDARAHGARRARARAARRAAVRRAGHRGGPGPPHRPRVRRAPPRCPAAPAAPGRARSRRAIRQARPDGGEPGRDRVRGHRSDLRVRPELLAEPGRAEPDPRRHRAGAHPAGGPRRRPAAGTQCGAGHGGHHGPARPAAPGRPAPRRAASSTPSPAA